MNILPIHGVEGSLSKPMDMDLLGQTPVPLAAEVDALEDDGLWIALGPDDGLGLEGKTPLPLGGSPSTRPWQLVQPEMLMAPPLPVPKDAAAPSLALLADAQATQAALTTPTPPMALAADPQQVKAAPIGLLAQPVHQEALLHFKASATPIQTWLQHEWPQLVYQTNHRLQPEALIQQLSMFAQQVFADPNIPPHTRIFFAPEHILMRGLTDHTDPQAVALQGIEWSKGLNQEHWAWLTAHLQQLYPPHLAREAVGINDNALKKIKGTGVADGVFYLPQAKSHSMAWAVLSSTAIACLVATCVLLWLI